jgi:hypothetical protein
MVVERVTGGGDRRRRKRRLNIIKNIYIIYANEGITDETIIIIRLPRRIARGPRSNACWKDHYNYETGEFF